MHRSGTAEADECEFARIEAAVNGDLADSSGLLATATASVASAMTMSSPVSRAAARGRKARSAAAFSRRKPPASGRSAARRPRMRLASEMENIPKPAVVTRAAFAPLRSSSALVAMVVPWTNARTVESSVSRASSASRTPCLGRVVTRREGEVAANFQTHHHRPGIERTPVVLPLARSNKSPLGPTRSPVW